MLRTVAAFVVSVLLAGPALAATPDELTTPIRQFINGFNSGDTKSAYAAYATGDITIIDEFAPHIWTGPNGAHAWAAQYDKHATATGVTDGSVTLGNPTRIEEEGNVAYVICPTVYNYKENGVATAEEGQMTYVLNNGPQGWKIRAWTWSGVKPHPAH